jgi:ABC-type antimicrobial peptide transport system permease subunit
VFHLSYMLAELRRRRSRTILTALGLAVGVGLVVSVNALSTGLDRAQSSVLAPLTGVGTDMSVTRPIKLSSNGGVFGQLSTKQQNRLRQQTTPGARFGFNGAKPGSKIDSDVANSPQVSFSDARVGSMASLANVSGAAGYLTLDVNHITGTVPKVKIVQPQQSGSSSGGSLQSDGPPGFGGFGNSSIKFSSRTVTGIDQAQPSLAPVTPSQIATGSYFDSGGGAYQAIVSQSYAHSNDIAVGDTITLFGKDFTVVGISKAPLGGTSSNIYVELTTLQKLAGYTGEINGVNVRAASSGDVSAVASAIKSGFKGSSVTTAADLAKRVGGSLTDAKNLSSTLGTALEAVGLLAAVLIACLLTLSSVSKRVREIGTLKALGWSQSSVVRQISGESLLQGLLGGVIGAAVGVAGAAAINAVGWTLKASVAAASAQTGPRGPGGFGLGPAAASSPTAGSQLVKITTSVDFTLLLVAIGLAVAGGLISGAVGGLRAARLRPAAALRTVE